jgi:hypothetical protein
VSLEVNRRWARHVETELQRLGLATPAEAIAIGGETGVILCAGPMSQRPIVSLGSMALMVLVQLPDGAGVDAAWGALSSLPDIDAAIARAGADPAAGQALREEVARELAEGPEDADIKRALEANDWRLGPVAAPPDPRWPAALWREADEVERYNPEDAESIRAALAIGVRSEREARLVLAALGYSNPDAVERVLQGEGEEAEPEAAPEAPSAESPQDRYAAILERRDVDRRIEKIERSRLGRPREVFATSEAPEPARRASTLIFVPDGVEPEAPSVGAMRPETLRHIEAEILATMAAERAPSAASDLVALAFGQVSLAATVRPADRVPPYVLRAIAYLVRRLELEAPAPEQGRDEPR